MQKAFEFLPKWRNFCKIWSHWDREAAFEVRRRLERGELRTCGVQPEDCSLQPIRLRTLHHKEIRKIKVFESYKG